MALLLTVYTQPVPRTVTTIDSGQTFVLRPGMLYFVESLPDQTSPDESRVISTTTALSLGWYESSFLIGYLNSQYPAIAAWLSLYPTIAPAVSLRRGFNWLEVVQHYSNIPISL